MLKYEHIFQIKYREAILSNNTRKLLWFEITKMLIAVKKLIYRVIYYNFWHNVIPNIRLLSAICFIYISYHVISCLPGDSQ